MNIVRNPILPQVPKTDDPKILEQWRIDITRLIKRLYELTYEDILASWAVTNPFSKCRVYHAGYQTINASWDKIEYDVDSFDNDSIFNSSTHRITPTSAGYYIALMTCSVFGSVGDNFSCSIYVDGASYSIGSGFDSLPGTVGIMVAHGTIYCDGTTYIEGWGYCDVSGFFVGGETTQSLEVIGPF